MEQRPWDFNRGIAEETGRVDETEGTSNTEEIDLAEESTHSSSFIEGYSPTDQFSKYLPSGIHLSYQCNPLILLKTTLLLK